MIPVCLTIESDYIFIGFKYNKALLAEVKMMEGAKWLGFEDPPRKIWRVSNSDHNHFQLLYLSGHNPYKIYDAEIIKHQYDRPLYEHQKAAADFLLTRKRCILAGETGSGKSLAVIEAMERSGVTDWAYVAPKSAIKAVELELRKWKSKIQPDMMSYERLLKIVKQEDFNITWDGIWFDESSRIKSPNAQRSQAAVAVSDIIRKKDGYIILTSGTPAPRSPLDWHNQVRIACPGFLREANYHKFRQTLAIVSQVESPFGQAYPQIVSWLDDSKKCKICGKYQEDHCSIDLDQDHTFEPSVNECERLYKRLNGLVLVQFKKDCLDLPEKIYRQIELKPSKQILEIAKALVSGASTVATGLILLRELSDGFQYQESVSGEKTCSVCNGKGTINNPGLDSPLDEVIDKESKTVICDGCGGSGYIKTYSREALQIDTPKEEALRDLLDEYSEIGRIVIYAGFTGSIDRCVRICQDLKWDYIRVDGRGWHSNLSEDYLDNFQNQTEKYPRIAFIGQPGAAGMGLTLTASPVIIYYSNDFNAESRVQSEDRIHRPGSRGCTIIDLLHLKTDYLVLNNLKKKRDLQSITMGEIKECF